jgi:hypothetical protein
MISATRNGRSERYIPAVVLVLLLIICSIRGYATVAGLERPADWDSFRDIGYVQALLDGNWLGDPLYGGEVRFYSPLMHVITAAAVWVTGIPPMTWWVQASPWFNLLAPLAFFDMNRRLFDLPTAAFSTVIFTLFNGLFAPPWIAAGYTPWPFICSMALPLFFAGVSVVYKYGESTRLEHAALTGALLGLIFLAHPYPAILLTAILVATSLAKKGLASKTVVWLATAAFVEFLLALLVLGPLFIKYHLHTLNYAPAFWFDPISIFDISSWGLGVQRLGLLVYNGLGFLLVFVGLLLHRRAPHVDLRTATILLTWIGVCAVLLLRHYACTFVGNEPFVCRISLVPVHHSHFYLQAAWACLWGFVLCTAVRWLSRFLGSRAWSPPVVLTAVVVVACGIVLATAFLFKHVVHRTYDFSSRQLALSSSDHFDRSAYHWILKNSGPRDLFVTEEAANEQEADRAFTVMATGRRLVSIPISFSNPYVDWNERDARRRRYLSALTDSVRGICDLVAEAGEGASAWFLVANGTAVNSVLVDAVLRTDFNTLYRVRPDCKG